MLPFTLAIFLGLGSAAEFPGTGFDRIGYSSAMYSDRESTEGTSRWKGALGQIAPGVAGGLMGSFVGGLVGTCLGAVVGAGSSASDHPRDPDKDAPLVSDPLATMLFGMAIGAGVGEGVGTGVLVHLSADADRPSRGMLPPIFGGTLGFAAGAYGAYKATDGDGGGWIVLTGIAGSTFGAIALDRLASRDAKLSVWSPRPGLEGARLSVSF